MSESMLFLLGSGSDNFFDGEALSIYCAGHPHTSFEPIISRSRQPRAFIENSRLVPFDLTAAALPKLKAS